MKVVIIGATGTIGKAIATLLNERGYEVVPVTRHTQPGVDISDPRSISAFYTAIGEVDAIIAASAGTLSYCTVSELNDQEIDLDIKSKFLGQVNLVRQGLSSVRPGGVFILTGGIFAYNPWPKSSVIAMVNAGLEGFVRGASLDLMDTHRVVIVHPPSSREWAIQVGMDGAPWPTAAMIAETYLMALENRMTGQSVFVEGYYPSRLLNPSACVGSQLVEWFWGCEKTLWQYLQVQAAQDRGSDDMTNPAITTSMRQPGT